MNTVETKPVDYTLDDADIAHIEEMAAFYGITRDEAYQRFCSGAIDGVIIEDEVFEDDSAEME